jgi:hypothetical protein
MKEIETNEIFELKNRVQAEDYIAFNNFHLFHKDWRSRLLWQIGPFLMTGILVLAFFIPTVTEFQRMVRLFMIGLPAFFLVAVPLTVLTTRSNVKKFVASDKSLIGRSHRVVFSNQDLYSTCEEKQARIKWADVHAIYELPGQFLIYIEKMSAIIIPKAGKKEAELKRLRALLTRYGGSKFQDRTQKGVKLAQPMKKKK